MKSQKKKVLITGGNGFLGSAIVESMIAENFEVAIITRKESDLTRLSQCIEKIKVYQLGAKSPDEIIASFLPDIIIHTAVAYGNKESVVEVFKSNVQFFVDLLAAAIKNNVKHFLNTDTFSGKNIDYAYLKPYHASKRHMFEWANLMLEEADIKFSNMRLEHLYGPKDSSTKFMPFVMDKLTKNEKEINLTAGAQRRDFIFTQDAVSAFLAVIEMQETQFEEYEVGSGVSTSIREFVELLKEVSGNEVTALNFGALPTRAGEYEESKADISKLKKIGWEPLVSLRKGISIALADFNK